MEPICCRLLPKKLSSGSLEIIPFAVPHDAASTVGYVFKSGGSKCTYLTDVGFVTDEVRQNIADADVVVLEANHDEDMLKMAVIRRYSSRGFWEHAGIYPMFRQPGCWRIWSACRKRFFWRI